MPDAPLDVYVVWSPSYTVDNATLALEGAKIFTDKRVKQYWDTKTLISSSYGKRITLPRDAPLAYDVYFYFAKGMTWTDEPPMPVDYMHQVFDDGKWFDPPKFVDLVKAELAKPDPKP